MEQKLNTFNQKLTEGFSIEVTPRSAASIESLKDVLPQNTRVYIAHIENEDIQAMVNTAKRLNDEGFHAMPHFPARAIKNEAILNNWISMYKNEAGVDEALL